MTALIDMINGQPDTLHNPVRYVEDATRIIIDHTRPSSATRADTIKLTYQWSGDQLLEAWTYLNLQTPAVRSFQKRIITYDAAGNYNQEHILFEDGTTSWQMTALAFDDKKNFFRTLSPLNYIFIGWGFPYATRSVNNPLKAEGPGGELEYTWTYNQEGYPLTMQVKGEDFIAVELYYDR